MTQQRSSLSISVRRYFVDKFFFSHTNLFTSGARVLDIGGKKESKRGYFDINQYGAKVKYVNIDSSTNPDIISDASHIPVSENSYDIIIMGELLEHVPEPLEVLKEVRRILCPSGKALVTVPFLYPIHADPYDYGRFTEHYWREKTKIIGFSEIKIESQGALFAVMALAVQHLFLARKVSWRPIQIPLVSFLMWLDKKTTSPLLKAWTTGYGFVLTK